MKELERKLNLELSQKKKQLNTIKTIAIFLAVIYIFIFMTNLGKSFSFVIFLPAIISIASFVILIITKNKFLKDLKSRILYQVLPIIFNESKVIFVESGISKSEFEKSRIYEKYNEFFSTDGLKDYTNKFYIANVTAIRKEEENKIPVFTGIFGYYKINEFYENEIVIKPDMENKYAKNVIESKDKMFGARTNIIRLENNEFEKKFEVFSKDPIKARQVITTTYMENLLKLKSDLKATIKIIYKEDKKYIAIWNKRIINEKEIYKKGINIMEIKEQLEKIYELLKI